VFAAAWEALLAVLLVVTLVLVGTQTEVLSGRGFWLALGSVGLLAAGFALSVSTATPNLAVASIAALAGMIYAKLLDADWSGLAATAAAVLGAMLFGLVLGLAAGLTAAPGWAVSLGGLAVAQAILLAFTDGRSVAIGGLAPSSGTAALWVVLFVVLSIGGGVLWLVPAVRQTLGANRPDADAATWWPARLIGALVGFVGSSLLAGLSGIALAGYLGAAYPFGDTTRLTLAAGAVLLGGVSVFGRRGGVAGTVLAATLLLAITQALVVWDVPQWVTAWVPAALAIFIGLVVSRVLESVSRPEDPPR
jgi:ribose/xylose/arabinose/galactoside ABC-type transport system permease subunit